MFERFGFRTAAGAGGVGVLGPPGGVGGQVAFVGAHLMKASCDELVQAHERVGGVTAGVFVVIGWWVEGGPFLYHEALGPDLQGFVGACYKEGGGCSPRAGGVFSAPRGSARGLLPTGW